MATESPLRLTGSGGPSNWPVINDDNVTYSSPTANVATNDLVLLLNGHRFHGERELNAPNRCGSAPPIIESFRVPSGNLKGQQSSNRNGSFENPSNVVGSCESEEDVRAHPSYLSYYCSNINLNPRLPPPIISQENRRLVHHIGIFAEDWRTLSISQTALSTHKEEPDDDKSPRLDDSGGKNNLPLSQEFKPLQGRHKSVVDLIQEDFPRTPSPVYNDLLPPSNHSTAERAADPDVAHSLHDSSAGLIPSSDAAPCHKGKSAGCNAILDNSVTPDAVSGSNINRNEGVTDNLKMSNDEQSGPHAQQAQNLISQSQMVTQRMHHVNWAANHLSRGRSKSSSVEAQPVLQPTGTTLPLYATTAAYGSPYYPNIHPSALIPPPFNFGGYAINTTLTPPFITGYLPHGAVPIPFENHPGLNFDVRNSGAPGFELQHLYKFYGQLGVEIQPLMDPLYMPYLQHLSLDTYSGTGRFNAMAPGGSTIGIPPSIYDSLNQKPQILRGGFVNTPSSRQGGIIESNCYSTTPNTGASPFISPVYKGPSISGTSFSRTKMENMKPSLGSGRTPCTLSGWQGERGRSKCNGPKPNSFLEELKCSRGHRFELSDITGLVVDFSADQHGSRYIQQKLETCSIEEKTSVFNEVLPHASALMTDVFGNYVIQKFFEHGSSEQRKELANQLTGHVLPLSLQMYGCRVIQKALEVVELDKKIQLAYELDGHILRCVRDQNGNHVIQKCIECIPSEQIGFIISAFRGQVSTLSMHPYGCRVIQRVLEHCIDELQSNCIVDEILQSVSILAEDQYGNYVIQHVLERGKPQERSQIIRKLAGQVVHMSQHKFASNVIEKCLEHGDTAEQELLIEEIVGQTEGNNNLLAMMKDQFANYVIQKILETSTGEQREVLLNRIKNHLQALKKYTYGKHIVARVEQLCDQGCNVSD